MHRTSIVRGLTLLVLTALRTHQVRISDRSDAADQSNCQDQGRYFNYHRLLLHFTTTHQDLVTGASAVRSPAFRRKFVLLPGPRAYELPPEGGTTNSDLVVVDPSACGQELFLLEIDGHYVCAHSPDATIGSISDCRCQTGPVFIKSFKSQDQLFPADVLTSA